MSDEPYSSPLADAFAASRPSALDVAALSPPELEAKRREIVEKAQGNWESLSTEDLRDLALVTSALRRRTAGPPKAGKKAAGAKRPAKPNADQILADI